jgi:glycosyltransferase involved in cell wall biosynthesis
MDKVTGKSVDLFVGIFDNFEQICRDNSIKTKVLWCAIPTDNCALLEACDIALAVGNRTTLSFFPEKYRSKVRLINYGVSSTWTISEVNRIRANDFVHVATEAAERKGFKEVMEVWSKRREKLHILGYLHDPVMKSLYRTSNIGQMMHYGYVPSDTEEYKAVLSNSRFVYLPTHYEGQVGTLIEAMHLGMVALTTLESGLDEHVLDTAFITDPKDTVAQSKFVDKMLGMSDVDYLKMQDATVNSVRDYQSWVRFDASVGAVCC